MLKKIAICDLLFICVAGIGLPAQKKKKKICPLGFDLADFRQKVPWERSRVAFSEVIFGENIGRTDKLSRSCKTTDAGLSYGIGIVVVGQKPLEL